MINEYIQKRFSIQHKDYPNYSFMTLKSFFLFDEFDNDDDACWMDLILFHHTNEIKKNCINSE